MDERVGERADERAEERMEERTDEQTNEAVPRGLCGPKNGRDMNKYYSKYTATPILLIAWRLVEQKISIHPCSAQR